MYKLIVDPGNSYIKSIFSDENNQIDLKTVYSSYNLSRVPEKVSGKFYHPPKNGARVDLENGERYEFGDSIKNPSYIADQDKLDFIKVMVFSCIPKSGDYSLSLNFHTLDVEYINKIKKDLIGSHKFKKNNEDLEVNIKDLKVYGEGYGSAVITLHILKNIFGNDNINNFILFDIGHGTVIQQLWELDESFNISHPTNYQVSFFGISKVIEYLSNDEDIAFMLKQKTLSEIDKRLLTNSLKTKFYGNPSEGIDLSKAISFYKNKYKNELINLIKNNCRDFLLDTKIRIFSGGGADFLDLPSIYDKVKHKEIKHYKLMKNCSLSNVIGLAYIELDKNLVFRKLNKYID